LVFASPAALTNVLATAEGISTPAIARVRTVMSAGAPVGVPLLERMQGLAPNASLHTPYGMTEVLPVADIDLDALRAAGPGHGVCVGHQVDGCEVRIDPANSEVLIATPWCSTGYDRLDDTQRQARSVDADGRIWHRSGDLGHLDESGRLWIEGRLVHRIETATSTVSPVPLEIAAESCEGVSRAAAVGVGPLGAQQVVIVVEAAGARSRSPIPILRRRHRRKLGLASLELTGEVRAAIGTIAGMPPVAAVLAADRFPVDVRHNSKIDRTLLAAQAERLLAGR
jgi:acyl-coenzyme A synthetase/AMP-(fatty) acid ligase